MFARVTVRVVGRQKRGTGLTIGEAQWALASLGQGPREEGGGNAWLLAYVGTMRSRLGLA